MSTKIMCSFLAVTLLAGVFAFVPVPAIHGQAVSTSIVVSQVYGGGGNSGAIYTHDYIELFNLGNTPVSVDGWSVQYAATTGSSWSKTDLSGTIQPGQYFLVQEAKGAGGTTPLPTPDVTGTLTMGGTAGKIALVNNTTLLSGLCPTGLVDFVGYGTSTNCFEGTATGNLSNTLAAKRVSNGCTDSDNNLSDFTIADPTSSPTPRNSASPINLCNVPILSFNDVTVTEGNSGTVSADFTVSLTVPAGPGGVSFDIATADNTATTADNDYVAQSLTGMTISTGNLSYTFSVLINGDNIAETNETFLVNVSNVAGANSGDLQGLGTISDDDTALTITPIYDIQGSGSSTPIPGATVTTRGIVVSDEEGASPALRGFYIQASPGDGNPATSDGLFVYNTSNNNVSKGDAVQVTGTVSEYFGQTQLSASSITLISTANTVTPTTISLPFSSASEPEQYEGMLVRFEQALYVTEHYLLSRFGQVSLSSSARLPQPTGIALPGSPALAVQAANDLNQVILDDSLQNQNPDPILFGRGGLPLSASNTLRAGDSITNLVGVLAYIWAGNSASPEAYRILPVNALGGGVPNFSAVNLRPATPPLLAGDVTVVGMNLYNYFNTFGSGACSLGVGGASTDCRGASNSAEFDRQWAKLVNVIDAMRPDVLGIAEMENDGYGPSSAIQDLVTRLNEKTGSNLYAFLDVDTLSGKLNALGTDAIKVGLIYQPASLIPVGTTAVLDTTAFVNGGDSFPRNRVALLQAFETPAGQRFLVNVNHLKSKGSACDVPDAGDGQGNCNIVRTNAVNALVAWLASDPTGTGDPDLLILGDMNSYALEDPITAFTDAGYTNLVNTFGGMGAYSYVFDGQWGYLDHALASPSLLGQVMGVQEWHINADEPAVLDYNTEFKTSGQQASLYSSEPFRAGDHDPILVGLSLSVPFSKSLPAGGTTGVPDPVTLSWNGQPALYGYQYCIDTSADDACGTSWIPTFTDTTAQINGLSRATTYYWQVRAVAPGGTLYADGGAWSTFTTGSSFEDVSSTHWALNWIERLYAAGITGGCKTSPLWYCPENPVTRAQMAVFMERGLHGASFVPPNVEPSFWDTTGHWAEDWIEALYADGITAGCGPERYCPENFITRAQMAIFLVRGKYGADYVPPAVTDAVFIDVPASHWAAAWIKQLVDDGITAGCGNGYYCPENPLSRAQMAVFLVRTFNLP